MSPARHVLLAGVALTLGCASTLQSVEYPLLREAPPTIRRLAVAPFRPEAGLAAEAQARRAVADQVAGFVFEAAAARGIELVAPSDLAHALEDPESRMPAEAPQAARLASQEFGADAILLGTVLRFRKRAGEALGTTQPASVAFEVTLYSAPGGERLWSARFDETQQALLSNVLNLGRYPGGGTRWLTAEELARWGAHEVAKGLPLGATGP